MCPPDFLVAGVLAVAVGLPAALWPRKIAWFGEVLDAVGRAPAGRVEPAGWNVGLTRILGAALTLAGAPIVGTCLL